MMRAETYSNKTTGFSDRGSGTLTIPPLLDCDNKVGVRAHRDVPMLRIFGSFDGPEILMLAAASLLIVSLAFCSDCRVLIVGGLVLSRAAHTFWP